jgi:excinuclease ABC subunit B
MYADTVTASMKTAIGETERRRALQAIYNTEHNITPESIVRHIDEVFSSVYERDYSTPALTRDEGDDSARRRSSTPKSPARAAT